VVLKDLEEGGLVGVHGYNWGFGVIIVKFYQED